MLRVVVLMIVIASTATAAAQDRVADSPWCPAAEGTAWTYRLAARKVTVKVTKHEKQSGIMTARMETIDAATGNVVAVQHVAITDKEVRRVAHNGEKVDPPLVLLKLPAAKGQSWDIDAKMQSRTSTDVVQGKCTTDEEEIEVPVSKDKLKAVRVTAELTINGRKSTLTAWFAEKYGMVKHRLNIGGVDHEMVLEKMELPK